MFCFHYDGVSNVLAPKSSNVGVRGLESDDVKTAREYNKLTSDF